MPAPPAPPAPPPAPPAGEGLKCPGCDGPLDRARYCRECDSRVDTEGDLVPVGILGRVAALEAGQDRDGKVGRLLEKATGLDLDTLDVEKLGPADLVAAVVKKAKEVPATQQEAIKGNLLELIPEDLRAIFQ